MYIENYSLILDINLILMTIRIMFKKESTEGFAEDADVLSVNSQEVQHIKAQKETV